MKKEIELKKLGLRDCGQGLHEYQIYINGIPEKEKAIQVPDGRILCNKFGRKNWITKIKHVPTAKYPKNLHIYSNQILSMKIGFIRGISILRKENEIIYSLFAGIGNKNMKTVPFNPIRLLTYIEKYALEDNISFIETTELGWLESGRMHFEWKTNLEGTIGNKTEQYISLLNNIESKALHDVMNEKIKLKFYVYSNDNY